MQRALYAGTFDPFTFGHLDILQRALTIFDEVEVTIARNAEKRALFGTEDRVAMVESATADLRGVHVTTFEGLLVDHAKATGATALIRGLRQVSDFDYEMRMAFGNRRLAPDIETVFLTTSEKHAFISSSTVRDIHRWGGDISSFVPSSVQAIMHVASTSRT
ncbi:MAG: pantetheine-phosphate adenylyltransferase [Bacteroidetes bacterium]|jgi:pantetheine-phosphate adenylyltransferase|nr:pantetheine-phosphate adenylyltransferase [Bacteroidota bacterium]